MVSLPPIFELLGRVVTHIPRPGFQIVFQPAGDTRGGWVGRDPDWLDGPPIAGESSGGPAGETTRQFASRLARLAREAGDFFAAHLRDDWIQEAVIARAGELGLSAYAVAKATGGAVSEDHVLAYLSGRKSMGSHKLQHVLRALSLVIVKP